MVFKDGRSGGGWNCGTAGVKKVCKVMGDGEDVRATRGSMDGTIM